MHIPFFPLVCRQANDHKDCSVMQTMEVSLDTMQTMEVSLDAVRHNQDVIAELLKGRYEASLSHAHKALDVMQTILNRPRPNGDDATSTVMEAADKNVGQRIWSIPLSPMNETITIANGGAVAFFNRALAVHIERPVQDVLHEDMTLATAVLYNAGLCHHVSAIHCAEFRTQRLRKALKMYTMASCLVSSTWDSTKNLLSGCDEGISLLVLALLNNMAHIHSYFLDFDLATECLDAMNDILETASMGTEGDESDIAVDLLSLSMAATLYRKDSFAGCPAA